MARTGFARNLAYRWSHMITNIASVLFGYLYISLWWAVAPVKASPGNPYTRSTMTGLIALAQVIAWVSIFLPSGLGIQDSIRSGKIALEMARPVPFFPMVLAREAGNLAYQALYRSVPMIILFGLSVGIPGPASWGSLVMAVPSVVLAGYIALTLVYSVGISSLWTTEVRWAHWIYYTLVTQLSGGWVPADLLPGVLGKVAPYLPFAAQAHWPIRIYLGLSGPEGLLIQAAWAVALTWWCTWITRQAFSRVVVQGG